MVPLTIIVAARRNNGIGQGSRLPWRLPQEMAYFAKITKQAPNGHINALIMGRKTWESIPKKNRPLVDRINIVITGNPDYKLEPVKESSPSVVEHSLDSGLARLMDDTLAGDVGKKINRSFIIGGASIYKETLALELTSPTSPIVDRILLTRILTPDFPDCDVFFPEFEGKGWTRASHDELEKWAGFEVAKGTQEEKGVYYEFQMWVRTGVRIQ